MKEFEEAVRALRADAERRLKTKRVEELAYWGTARRVLDSLLRELKEIRSED